MLPLRVSAARAVDTLSGLLMVPMAVAKAATRVAALLQRGAGGLDGLLSSCPSESLYTYMFVYKHIYIYIYIYQGSGFRVQGSGFRVQGSGFRVQGAGFRVQGSGFRVQGAGCRVQGAGFRVQVAVLADVGRGHLQTTSYHCLAWKAES